MLNRIRRLSFVDIVFLVSMLVALFVVVFTVLPRNNPTFVESFSNKLTVGVGERIFISLKGHLSENLQPSFPAALPNVPADCRFHKDFSDSSSAYLNCDQIGFIVTTDRDWADFVYVILEKPNKQNIFYRTGKLVNP